MPRRKYKSGNKICPNKSISTNFVDVTINDFANSTVAKGQGRLKKAVSIQRTNIVREVKNLAVTKSDDSDDRAWYEKLEEFDKDFDFVQQEDEEDDEGAAAAIVKRPAPRLKKKTICEDDDNDSRVGIEYPIDIWFLISEHLDPEDVGTFSGICRSALQVTNTAEFWFKLYRRHYKSVPNLPERLQPECMMRLYGLKSSVVRALHFMYPPFINKLKTVTTFEDEPHNLTKRQCILMWHQKCKNNWLFFFKLKSNKICFGHRPVPKPRKPDLLEMLEDVSANQDDGCKVLQVTCMNYISLPMVLGMTLCSVSLHLSQGLRYHRLQLGFGADHMCHMVGKPNMSPADSSGVLILDPVVNVRVLDWWHPLYPHNSNTGFNIQIQDVE